jgi:hypothetical protein
MRVAARRFSGASRIGEGASKPPCFCPAPVYSKNNYTGAPSPPDFAWGRIGKIRFVRVIPPGFSKKLSYNTMVFSMLKIASNFFEKTS